MKVPLRIIYPTSHVPRNEMAFGWIFGSGGTELYASNERPLSNTQQYNQLYKVMKGLLPKSRLRMMCSKPSSLNI
jgi:hypothetical protein